MFDSSKKRIASLSYENMTKKIYQQLNPKEKKNRKQRKQNRNKNKKKVRDKIENNKNKGNNGKVKKDDSLFDFSQYNREKDDLSSDGSISEKEDIDQEQLDKVSKYEQKRIDSNKAYSWDTINDKNKVEFCLLCFFILIILAQKKNHQQPSCTTLSIFGFDCSSQYYFCFCQPLIDCRTKLMIGIWILPTLMII